MDTALVGRVEKWLTAHRQEIIDDLVGLVQIPSVSIPDEQVPPFGQTLRDALQYMYDLAAKHGYATKDYDHYIGAVQFSEGDASVGFWAHVDVVPVPDPAAWDYPPFACTLVNDRYLIGRGVQDNKMAAIGVFHAMNCLRELGVPLRHGYTLYLGTSEETGMADARYFVEHYPCPDMSIVPDCGFPVCIAQRGSMRVRISVPFAEDVTVTMNNHPSVTPETLTLHLPDGDKTFTGVSSHIGKAEGQPNAVLTALTDLAERFPAYAESIRALQGACIPYDGSGFGADVADELSGKLATAATGLEVKDGRLAVSMMAVLPVCFDKAVMLPRMEAACAKLNATCELLSLRTPVSFPRAHPAVKLLTDTYNELTGEDSAPYVMTGGNYAAYLPNAFGYGPGMPGREFPPEIFRPGHGDFHQCDESDDVEHILAFMRIMAMSIVAVDQLDQIKA